jgi:hypothetical protein
MVQALRLLNCIWEVSGCKDALNWVTITCVIGTTRRVSTWILPNPLRSSYPLEFRNSRLPSGEQVHFANICTQLTSWALGSGPILSNSLSFDIRCHNLQHSSQDSKKAVLLNLTYRDLRIPISLRDLNPGYAINTSLKNGWLCFIYSGLLGLWTSSILRYTTEHNIPSKGERVTQQSRRHPLPDLRWKFPTLYSRRHISS